jgi:hypothetical protein
MIANGVVPLFIYILFSVLSKIANGVVPLFIYILFISVPSKIANGHTSPELLQQTLTDALEKKTALGKH